VSIFATAVFLTKECRCVSTLSGTCRDSATLQSAQCITNAAYNQRSLQLTPLFTAWFKHQIWGQYMFGSPERLPAFGARTFFYCNHNNRGSGLKLKNRWCWLYDALIIHCVARIVAEPMQAHVEALCNLSILYNIYGCAIISVSPLLSVRCKLAALRVWLGMRNAHTPRV
jgi:hypothetical protein